MLMDFPLSPEKNYFNRINYQSTDYTQGSMHKAVYCIQSGAGHFGTPNTFAFFPPVLFSLEQSPPGLAALCASLSCQMLLPESALDLRSTPRWWPSHLSPSGASRAPLRSLWLWRTSRVLVADNSRGCGCSGQKISCLQITFVLTF